MTTKYKRSVRVWLTTLLILAASAQSLAASTALKYQGVWEGEMVVGSKTHLDTEWKWGAAGTAVRIAFAKKSKVFVYLKQGGEWVEVKPGAFRMIRLDTNAVVMSIDSGLDRDGTWVETWSFALTHIDATRIHIMWQRQVKNKHVDLSNPNAVFGYFGSGELVKTGGVTR